MTKKLCLRDEKLTKLATTSTTSASPLHIEVNLNNTDFNQPYVMRLYDDSCLTPEDEEDEG